jgi:hypothetical protein
MKIYLYLLLLPILLSSCAPLSDVVQLLRTPTPVPPADTATPIPSFTPAPTLNLFATSTSTPLTFTPTVTQIGAELFTPTGTATDYPTLYAPSPIVPSGASSDTYFTPTVRGFRAVLLSNSQMFWNNGPCDPREIKFSAFVEDTVNTNQVLLFTRLREKSDTLLVTDWNSGAIMVKADNGSYNYTLHTWNMDQYYWFKNAYLEYQLVSTDKDFNVIARTPVYDRNLSLVMCHPLQ